MRLIASSLVLILLPACASSSGTPRSTRPETVTMNGGSMGSLAISNSTVSDVQHVAHDVESVWRIMPSVFDSLSIPVNVLNPGTKTIGATSYKVRQRLGKANLSKYLECGTTQIGPNADSYDVLLSVSTTVMPDGAPDKTKVVTLVEAQARPITFNQGYNRCTSKGALETRVVEIITARLNK